ncbi:hypothetical protein CEP53_000964 [Fusarium sp. AF-6]|nr:hypothetical protein CEP53_000964 [Fusarium sp. AF-6]
MAHPFVSDSHILYRAMLHRPEKVISASGVSLFLEDGREIPDASAGPSVSCLGFGRPEISEAVSNQISQLSYIYSGARFTCDATEELASLLLQGQPGGLSKAIFVNSGSEATDAAIKLATQYWHERGMPQKRHFIARKQSYHGNTIGALCISGHDSRRAMYRDWLSSNVSFVGPCFPYRLKKSQETNKEYVKRLADQLEAGILRVGPENVAAFVAKTISGTTLGCLPAAPGYFKTVRTICDKYDVLLILDEIMCGMGKTGTMHAWEQENISGPDIQTIGKALGGGYIPLFAVLLCSKIFDALADGSGILAHGHTFQAHPVACAAALEVQRIIRDEDLLGNVARMGQVLEPLLKEKIGPLEKKKCDQIYPVCTHCSRLNLVCKREAPHPLKSTSPAPSDTATKVGPVATTAPRVELQLQGVTHLCQPLGLPLSESSDVDMEDLVGSRRAMLRYYTVTFAFLLTTNLENNCFLFALVSAPSWIRVITPSRISPAESTLDGDLSRSDNGALSMESISEATDSWYPHLAGAAAALTQGPNSPSDPKQAVQVTFEGRWLLRNFAYHDVMMSVSMNCPPLVRGFYWATEDDSLPDPYFGFASRLLFLVSETSVLNADFVEANNLSRTGQTRARNIEDELQKWVCPSSEVGTPLALLGEAYRNAALIHLYRALRRHVSGYTAVLQAKINSCVQAIVMFS